jgi:predicted nucleic acid-binding protein
VELLSGAKIGDLTRLQRIFSAIPTYFPTVDTWAWMEASLQKATKRGERFGFADLLIAGIAFENSGTLWSLDKDYTRMERLGLIRRYSPSSRP